MKDFCFFLNNKSCWIILLLSLWNDYLFCFVVVSNCFCLVSRFCCHYVITIYLVSVRFKITFHYQLSRLSINYELNLWHFSIVSRAQIGLREWVNKVLLCWSLQSLEIFSGFLRDSLKNRHFFQHYWNCLKYSCYFRSFILSQSLLLWKERGGFFTFILCLISIR